MVGALSLSLAAVGCGGGGEGISSDEEARRAYLGLDLSIEKSLNLGFDGFNSASSANISPQMTVGDDTGMLTISGQVDQGASDNKGMRLYVFMVEYSDGLLLVELEDGEEVEVALTYDTSDVVEEQPYLVLQLRNIPNGTFTGTLSGIYFIDGDIDGEVDLQLEMSGDTEEGEGGTVVRVPGSTTITGTASSGDGLHEVNVTI